MVVRGCKWMGAIELCLCLYGFREPDKVIII